ncbi:MAG TPA: hypothetical protein VEW69_04270 [Alphaproteobacteria bacterium]|nr:hypothetical protein [Alphaproteobacteria bacterium]
MRWLQRVVFVLLATSLMLGQTNPPNNSAASDDTKQIADQLKKMQESLNLQQKQIADQQLKIDALEKELGKKAAGTAQVVDAALKAPATAPATMVSDAQDKPKESPLSFRIGGADFTPGGFVDFETVFRTTNATQGANGSTTGNPIATSFGNLPFNNQVTGHMTEFHMTGQYSRYNLKVTDKFGANTVTGYLEGDFNGNDAANVFVTANGHTNRLRLYWVDLKRNKWEFLGGSSWGWITPNRTGLSPMPADLAITYGEDANVHVGIPYTRAGTFRAVYHPNDNWAMGVSVENPDQFVNSGEVIFPFAFNAALGGQFDAANSTTAPSGFPDFIPKIAYDNTFGNGQHFHFEAGGLLTSVKITNVPIGGITFVTHKTVGGAGEAAFNVDVVKGFRVLANGLWGQGAGRYMIGLGPQAVVRPIQMTPTTFDIEPSMVKGGAGLVGFELQPSNMPNSQFGAYYGGVYLQRNAFPDTTSPIVLPPTALVSCQSNQPAQNKPCVGFGGTNSPNSANRAIQEASFDWTQTLWKNPQHGALLFITQTSYLTRSPWFVAAGAPKNAHLMMGFVSLRYVLP